MQHYDIVIVGGGVVGMLTALALQHTDFKIAMLESGAGTQKTKKNIAIVLNETSLSIIDRIGEFTQTLEHAVAINKCIVSAKGVFGRVRMQNDIMNAAALGKVIALDDLELELQTQIKAQKNLTTFFHAKVDNIEVNAQEERI